MYDRVIWPEKYDPKTSAIYALNDIDVKAPPQAVWRLFNDGSGRLCAFKDYPRRSVYPTSRPYPRLSRNHPFLRSLTPTRSSPAAST